MILNIVRRALEFSLQASQMSGASKTLQNASILGRKLNIQNTLGKSIRPLIMSCNLCKEERRTHKEFSEDLGTQGEAEIVLSVLNREEGLFPDEDTPNKLFDGIRFADLPCLTIRCTKNNTRMFLINSQGERLMYNSCSMMGFKNAKKKTTVAAQSTGLKMGEDMLNEGYKTIKVRVKGFGPGRMVGIHGIALAGVNVVSISDITDINYTKNPRPKKRRRV